jgi:hypothetical protein
MSRMIVDAGQAFDHAGDAGQCPQLGGEPMRAGALPQRTVHASQVGGCQFRLPASAARAAQRGAPPAVPRCVPSTHALAAHLQGASHRRHDLAGGKQARRPTAALFQGLKVSA